MKSEQKSNKKSTYNRVPRRFKKLNIDHLDENLCGVAEFKGEIFHVKNVLPGERVEVELPHLKNKEREKEYIYSPSKIITESPDRVKVTCPYHNNCSNCTILEASYSRQITEKKAIINKQLEKIGCSVESFVEAKPFGYRNKVHLAFTEIDGQTLAGFFNEETHRVIPVRRCMLHGAWFETLAEVLNEWATENHLEAFKPWDKVGLLRFAVCRYLDGKIMVTIVSRENIRSMDKLYNKLCENFDEVSLWLNINTQENSKVFSDRFIHIDGPKKLDGKLLDIDFSLSPNSFFQVNTAVASKIYSDVLNFVEQCGANNVVDLYSGIGLTSIIFAKNGKNVTSIEIVPKAVEDAKSLAEHNGVYDKIKFFCGDCNNILPKLNVPDNNVFFVDPPRKGLGPQVCKSIIKLAPKNIIYLSCGPDSLADDLERLTKSGYSVEKAIGYDMFPNTKHVETVVLMSRA